MTRFFVDKAMLEERFTVLGGEAAAHARVLRLQKGDKVILSDGQGTDCLSVISDVSPRQLSLVIEERTSSMAEAKIFASVYVGFPKSDKLEHVIQKATELGAAEIAAFPCVRSVAKYDENTLFKKLPRWKKIAQSAAEQSGRGKIPEVLALDSFRAAMERAARADKALLFYENEQAHRLSEALASPVQSISLVTGPEGGFAPEEVQMARDMGLEVCTLGRRILRCETAPLCALSAAMYAAGEY